MASVTPGGAAPAALAKPTIGILGGTGAEGRGLATRLAAAGYEVVLGSRVATAAQAAAAEVAGGLPETGATPPSAATNLDAARLAEVVFVCVPYAAQAALLTECRPALQGKIVVHTVVPLNPPPRVAEVMRVPGGSAAEEAQAVLGDGVAVAAAFHHVAAATLAHLDRPIRCDILVCADDALAETTVLALAAAMGLRAYPAGGLRNAAVVEGLAAVLIGLNRRLKVKAAGIRLTEVPDPAFGP